MIDGTRVISIEKITWTDNTTCGRWRDKDEFLALEPVVCQSVGWVLKETDQAVWIVASMCGEPSNEVSDGTIILKVNISERSVLIARLDAVITH